MSKHDHEPPPPPCPHDKGGLRFCAQCDAVECMACGKEWKHNSPWSAINSSRFQQQPWPTQPVPMPAIVGRPLDPMARMQRQQNLGHKHDLA